MANVRRSGRFIGGVWVRNFEEKFDAKKAKEMREAGAGPANWYYTNVAEPNIKQVGRRSFVVGKEGMGQIDIPNYKLESERRRVLAFNLFLGSGAVKSKIFREGQGLMADPAKHSALALANFKGTWVSVDDLRRSDRLIEILGLIGANPGIRIRQIANLYNTSNQNIRRMVSLASAFGVKIHGRGKMRITNWGAFSKDYVMEVYESTDGMSSIVSKMKMVFDADAFDKMTGCSIGSRMKVELYRMWQEKVAEREGKIALSLAREGNSEFIEGFKGESE